MEPEKPTKGSTYYSDKGKNAEQLAYDLATQSFFVDWCFLNPKLADGNELCDLLVIFEDTALIWQIKDLKLDANGRYSKREVEKNLRQVTGARRRLLDLKEPVTLSNPRRHSELFDPNSIKRVLLFSVLMGEGEDYYSSFTELKGHIIHNVTRDFLQIVLKELNTISDFRDYYFEKERFYTQHPRSGLTINGGEEELLGWYVQHGRTFSDFEGKNHVFLDHGIWETLQKNEQYLAKREADHISYGWDSIIDRAHTTGTKEYEQIARELARPNRFQRRFLGQLFYEAMVAAHNDKEHDLYRRVIPNFEGRTYCFLFAGKRGDPPGWRKAELTNLCFVARGKAPQSSVVIGIATEKGIEEECSYDFCLVDLPEWGPEQEQQARDLQDTFGILRSPSWKEIRADEFPKLKG